MERLREAIVAQAGDVVTEVRRIADWRHQYGKMPWAWIGAAAAAGFLVVPRKPKPRVTLTPEQIAEIAKANGSVMFDRPPRPSLASVLAGQMGKVAIDAVVRLAGNRISNMAERPPATTAPTADANRTA
jgi:hypothetical protein